MGNDEILKAELEKAIAECERLREENARLRVRVGQAPDTLAPTPNQFSGHKNKKGQASATVTAESRPELKVSLFSSLFRGRDDVYAVRWEGKNGRTGMEGAPPRPSEIKMEPGDHAYGPVSGTQELRQAVADHYNRLYRQGKTSKYTANVTIASGGRLLCSSLP